MTPPEVLAYWLMTWTWLPGFVLLPTFGLLLFPVGRRPSPRWRPVGVVAAEQGAQR
jgi:two-component system, NarL family, sensor kinase